MQHERNRIISGQPLRQKICRGIILSVEDLGSPARIERARSHPNPAVQRFDLSYRRRSSLDLWGGSSKQVKCIDVHGIIQVLSARNKLNNRMGQV